jgi:predicted RNA-binding Zn-ribbon protein involved in translation (DUF1610 family)
MEKKKPQCIKCDSKQILFLKRTNKFLCRVCGTEWDKKKEIVKAAKEK